MSIINDLQWDSRNKMLLISLFLTINGESYVLLSYLN